MVQLHHSLLLDKERTQREFRISYRNPDEVMAYLERYPEIEGFMEAAQPELTRYFGRTVHVILEVITYPEESDHQEELVGWIQSSDDVDEGLDKLGRFDDDWFLDHMDEINGKFNFNIETI